MLLILRRLKCDEKEPGLQTTALALAGYIHGFANPSPQPRRGPVSIGCFSELVKRTDASAGRQMALWRGERQVRATSIGRHCRCSWSCCCCRFVAVITADAVRRRAGRTPALQQPTASTQLNSTENYGRRCLTPLGPHRHYILS